MRPVRIYSFLVLVVFGLLVGCGGGTQLATVKGTITLNGKPLKEAQIIFHPEKGSPAYGKVVDGQVVEVVTHNEGPGVALGNCKVQIQPIAAADMYAKEKNPVAIPLMYQDPAKTTLTTTIKEGENTIEFNL